MDSILKPYSLNVVCPMIFDGQTNIDGMLEPCSLNVAIVILIFYNVKPSDLRWTNKDGQYTQALFFKCCMPYDLRWTNKYGRYARAPF